MKEPLAEETMRGVSLKSLAEILFAKGPSVINSKSHRGIRATRPVSPIVRTRGPTMSAMDLTSNCLKEGCPVDLVSNLLEHLKAEPNPSAEVLKSMNELEDLLASSSPNKNDLERVVTDMNRMFSIRAPTMSAMDLASDCLKQGCPVDSVSNLLEHLKAVPNPSAEVVKSMEELEELLAASKPDKNELERVVRDMLGSFSAEAPPMSAMDLASDCLKEGCPVDLVANLLEHLKAVPSPSAEVATSIDELEKLLARTSPDKNALERVVGSLLSIFSAPRDTKADGYFWSPKKATYDLASDCLKDGCPVDMVSDLVTQLRAEENSSPEAEKIIKELEAVLALEQMPLEKALVKPNKNALEQLVTSVAKGLRASYGSLADSVTDSGMDFQR